MKGRVILFSIFTLSVLLFILHQYRKEGFQTEDAINPEEFGYQLVQAVKGPIKRLSSTLLDIPTWKERFTLATMNPVELARYQLSKQSLQ